MAVSIDGWVADSAFSVVVGTPDPADLRLIEATEVALEAAITAAQPGGRLGDISAVIGRVARSYGYGVNAEFGGHGVGRTMHEAPHVANDGRPGRGLKLEPGLTIAIEPWLCHSTRTAGRSAPPTAPVPPTPNTPSPSPPPAPGS
jgi:methionyl aminopeptidase